MIAWRYDRRNLILATMLISILIGLMSITATRLLAKIEAHNECGMLPVTGRE
jgi:hypothetical protein